MAKQKSLTHQLKRRHDLAQKIAVMRRELDEIDADVFARFGRLASALEGESQTLPLAAMAPSAEVRGKGKAVILPAVGKILRTHGYPLRTADILAMLTGMNIQVGGKRPIGNLSAQLSLSEQFESLEGAWWFKGEPRPVRSQASSAPVVGGTTS